MANKQSGILDVDIIGEKALLKAMDELSKPASRRKVMRPAIAEAVAAIAKAAKSNAPVETQELKKSLGSKTTTKGGNVIGIAGPRRGRKKMISRDSRYQPNYMNDPVRYAHLVEFGTNRTPAQPFMRPAMDNTDTPRIIQRRAAKEMARQTAKAAAKGQRFR